MSTSPVFWWTLLSPLVFLICLIALSFVRSRISSHRRAFLVTIWGSALLVVAFASVIAALLWASEAPAERLQNTPSNLMVGAGAGIGLVLGVGLGWLTRLEGERFLIAIFQPPDMTYPIPGWWLLPMLLLWLALGVGVFAVTYGILSYLALSR